MVVGFALIPTLSSAFPKIEIDSADFNAGTIHEGDVKSIKHIFKVKNTGDSTLLIHAKSGCECTIIEYDSIILPGQEGKVSSEVKIDKMHGGLFRKSIQITSNAKNDPLLQVSLSGNIKPEIAVLPHHIHLYCHDRSKEDFYEIFLASQRKDFAVIGASFRQQDSLRSKTSAQQQRFIPIICKLTKTDTILTDGYVKYRLRLSLDYQGREILRGEFIVKTNDPKKPEITIEGIIEPEKQ